VSTLEADLPSPGDLDLVPRIAYRTAVAGDYALRTALATALTSSLVPAALRPRGRRERQRLEFYAELAERRDSTRVFVAPERVEVLTTPGRGPGVPDGRVEVLRFASPYVALNPDIRRDYARHLNNATARAQHWRHESGPRPTLCVIHGFGASPAWFNTAFFSLKEFFASGWDVVLFTLPFHGSRRAAHGAVNGLGLFSHGMASFIEGIVHAVHDFRALLDHLEQQEVPRFGVTGLSLGGFTSALLAAVERRLDFVIPNAPVTHLPPLLDSWFPANVTARVLQPVTGTERDLLHRALALAGPLSYPPVLPHDRLMIVAGLGDRLAPPEQSLALWEHWRRPRLHWYLGSHVLHFGRGTYLAAMRELMDGSVAAS
jgi:pimeloyl-ACP methyl ester carboxylesterase